MAELQLWWDMGTEIGVHDSKRVEVGDMVSAHLVRTNEELDLKWDVRFSM